MFNRNQINMKHDSMLNLIQKQRWRRIKQILDSSQAEHYCQEEDGSRLSVLSKALGYAAPVDVVDAIIKTNPAVVDHLDEYGANALHVGCLNGAPFELIRYLACNYQRLTAVTDNDHRTPLHHAVEHACSDGGNFDYYTDVVELLCEKAPQTILLGDKGGETPTDIVQLIKMDYGHNSPEYLRMDNMYRLMKSHYIDYYMKQKKTWELNGYMKMAMTITSHSRTGTSMSSSSISSPQTKMNDEITSCNPSTLSGSNSLTSTSIITRSRQIHAPLINNINNKNDKIVEERSDERDEDSIPSSSKRKLRPSGSNEKIHIKSSRLHSKGNL